MMKKYCMLAAMMGVVLMASLVSADDSFEDDSDEWFGSRHRAPARPTWRSSPSTSSWRRRDDSDESDERWGGRWAQPAKRTPAWSAGRPLQAASNPWATQNNNNHWNSVWSNSGTNQWAPKQNKWGGTATTANKWNKWNTGKQSSFSNSGQWRNNNSWNRRWW